MGIGRKHEALNHAIEAVNMVIEDNKEENLDNSKDIFLANALVAKADSLSAVGNIKEAMDIYILVKNIYWNVYGIKNIGNMDNVGYAFAQAAKTAVSLPDKNDSHIQCFYFYSLLRDYFGIDHHRTKEVQGICP